MRRTDIEVAEDHVMDLIDALCRRICVYVTNRGLRMRFDSQYNGQQPSYSAWLTLNDGSFPTLK